MLNIGQTEQEYMHMEELWIKIRIITSEMRSKHCLTCRCMHERDMAMQSGKNFTAVCVKPFGKCALLVSQCLASFKHSIIPKYLVSIKSCF